MTTTPSKRWWSRLPVRRPAKNEDTEEDTTTTMTTPSKPKHYGAKLNDNVDDGNGGRGKVRFARDQQFVFDALEDTKQDRKKNSWSAKLRRENRKHRSQGMLTPHSKSPDPEEVHDAWMFKSVESELERAIGNKAKNASKLEKPLDYTKDYSKFGFLTVATYQQRLENAEPTAVNGSDYFASVEGETVLMAGGKEFFNVENFPTKVKQAWIKFVSETGSTVVRGQEVCFRRDLGQTFHLRNRMTS